MSIRKREWTTAKGESRLAWVVDYSDQSGNRHHRTFKRKSEAETFAATTRVQIIDGIHVAKRSSITVKDAGARWLASAQAEGLERTTIDQYEQHLRLHIVPFLGGEKLPNLTVPVVKAFRDKLRTGDTDAKSKEIDDIRRRMHAGDDELTDEDLRKPPRSAAMIRGIMGSLGALLGEAVESNLVARNVVREMRQRRRKGTAPADRQKRKLKVGVDIPTPDEVRDLLAKAKEIADQKMAELARAQDKDKVRRTDLKWRPFFMTAVFTGLRASELRGLRWDDIDLKKAEVHVRQRADRYNVIGPPKSAAGDRVVPLPSVVVSELRQWRLVCPRKERELGLVFPNGTGNVENHVNIVSRGLVPIMIAAGIVKDALDRNGKSQRDDKGKPIKEAKYAGMHMLRHFFASWCINRKEDGGLGLPPKIVQERLGHSSIVVTMDIYGHLFPRGDDTAELAAAAQLLA